MEFPTIVYKVPGKYKAPGGKGRTYDYCGAQDQKEFDALIAAGWFETIAAAQDAQSKPVLVVQVAPQAVESLVPADNAAPTRAELEIKATELGIKFDGRTTDSKLSERIEEALRG